MSSAEVSRNDLADTRATVETPRRWSSATTHSSVWQSEIWKASRQFGPHLGLAIFVVVLGQMLFAAMVPTLRNETDQELYQGLIYFLVAFAPLIFSVGVKTVAFGMEREERNLNWVASLPVAWWQVLLYRLFVWALGCCLSFLVVFPFGMLMHWLTGQNHLTSSFWQNLPVIYWQVWLVALQGLPLVIIGLLLVSGVANGAAVGLIAAFAVEVIRLLLGAVLEAQPDSLFWDISRLLTIIAVSSAAAVTFRWRTQTGLYATWESIWDRRSLSATSADRQPVSLTKTAKLWGSQFWLSMKLQRVMFGLLALYLAVRWFFAGRAELLGDFSSLAIEPPWLLLVSGLTGLGVFGHEIGRQDWRFQSDRGVAPVVYWWSRLRPTLVFFLGFLVAALFLEKNRPEAWLTSAILFGVWGNFLWAGATSRSWLGAIGAGLFFTFVLYLLGDMIYHAAGTGGVAIYVSSVFAIVMVLSYASIKALFHYGQRNWWAWKSAFFASIAILAFSLVPLLRIYSIPAVDVAALERQVSVPSQATDGHVLGSFVDLSSVQAGLPGLNQALVDSYLANPVRVYDRTDLQAAAATIRRNDQNSSYKIRELPLSDAEAKELKEQLPFDAITEQMDQIQAAMQTTRKTELNTWNTPTELQVTWDVADWCAEVAVIAAAGQDDELALRALQTYYRLLENNWVNGALSEYSFAGKILDVMPYEDWKRLFQEYPAEQLLPPQLDPAEARQAARQVYSQQIAAIDGATIPGPPTLISRGVKESLDHAQNYGILLSYASLWMGRENFASLPWEKARQKRLAANAFQMALERLPVEGEAPPFEYWWEKWEHRRFWMEDLTDPLQESRFEGQWPYHAAGTLRAVERQRRFLEPIANVVRREKERSANQVTGEAVEVEIKSSERAADE